MVTLNGIALNNFLSLDTFPVKAPYKVDPLATAQLAQPIAQLQSGSKTW